MGKRQVCVLFNARLMVHENASREKKNVMVLYIAPEC